MSEASIAREAPGPAGLGGWLILVGVGLVGTPIRLAALFLQTFLPIFRDGAWEVLTTPGSEAYHPLWAPVIWFELVGNTAFLAAALVLLVLFFKRSRRFPPLFIAYSLANVVFVVGDAWLGSLVVTNEPTFDPETARELSRSLIGAFIWVPYMLVSKRARNTFVE